MLNHLAVERRIGSLVGVPLVRSLDVGQDHLQPGLGDVFKRGILHGLRGGCPGAGAPAQFQRHSQGGEKV